MARANSAAAIPWPENFWVRVSSAGERTYRGSEKAFHRMSASTMALESASPARNQAKELRPRFFFSLFSLASAAGPAVGSAPFGWGVFFFSVMGGHRFRANGLEMQGRARFLSYALILSLSKDI